jgi:hypothetical protein
MATATSTAYLKGSEQKFYVTRETSFGTYKAPSATEAMAVLTTTIENKVARKDRRDAYQPSRGVQERITGKGEVTWGVDAYYIPSGTKNVAPAAGSFLQALLGYAEDVNADDVTYAQSSTQVPFTLTLTSYTDYLMRCVYGAVVDEMTLKVSGGDEPKIHFGGWGMGYVETGWSLTTAKDLITDKTIAYTTTDDYAFNVNSQVTVGTSTGHTIDTVDRSAHSFTVTVGMASEQASGVSIVPYVPTWTDAGVPMTGISGSLTWDSAALSAAVTSFDLSYKANVKANSDAAFQQYPTDGMPQFYECTGSIGMRVRRDLLVKILDRAEYATKALTVILGGADQSGTRATLTFAQVEQDWSAIQVPESEEVTMSLPFKVLESASGNDGLVWKHS